MSEAFDPYLRWLGIRDKQRPPNHYRLLGLDLFENDGDVIAVAADRQMAHLRTFQTGQFAPLSQRLLNELAAARISLLKPDKKATYDALLKKQLGDVPVAVRPKTPASDVVAEIAAANAPVVARSARDNAPSDGNPEQIDDAFPDFAVIASMTKPSSRAASPATKGFVAKKSASPAKMAKSLGPWIGLTVAGFLLVVGVVAMQQLGAPEQIASTDGSKNIVPTKTIPPNPVSSKTNNAGKPIPGSETPTKHDKTSNPVSVPVSPTPDSRKPDSQSVRPDGVVASADSAHDSPPTSVEPSSPPTKNSPDEPPVHSPQDVIRVENPAQPVPTRLADNGKPNTNVESKPDGHDAETPSTSKNPQPKKSKSVVDQASDTKPKRAPVPSKEQIAAAEAKVQRLFNVSAAKKPDERAALAKTLYAQGIDSNNQEVDRYVLLRMAMKDAATQGAADLAIQATQKLGETFDVNILEEKIGVLAILGKTVHTPEAAKAVVSLAQDLLDASLKADDFEAAKSVAPLAAGFAAKSGDAALARQLRQRLAEVDQIKKEYAKAESAHDTLQTEPDDPVANYVWGYYTGPIKGDFESGLPYLAKGSGKGAAELAKKELAQPTDPKAQTALADEWLDFGNSEREPARVHLRLHAAGWYSQAAAKLTGLEKKRVEDQIALIDPQVKASIFAGKNFIKILTEGTWTITWLPNPAATDSTSKSGTAYPNMKFNANGTCTNPYHSGTWTQDSPKSVVVHYKEPGFLQRFSLEANGQLECEYYNPPGTFQNHGIGTKEAAKPN